MTVGEAYNCLYAGALVVLALLTGVMLIRSIIGPDVTDRIVSINMIGTISVACIVILSAALGEGYLLDVALIYTMISFVTVLILASVYIPAKPKRSGFAKDGDGGAAIEKRSGGSASDMRAAHAGRGIARIRDEMAHENVKKSVADEKRKSGMRRAGNRQKRRRAGR